MKLNVVNSPKLLELKKRRRRIFSNKILLGLLGLGIIFVGLIYLSRLSVLNIQEVEVTGNKIIDIDVIQSVAEQEISGHYLWFVPKTNILFYPKNKIKKELSNQIKKLKDVNLSIKNNQILEVSVTERIALYTWCRDTIDLVVGVPSGNPTTEKCFFMDDSGYIFDEAPYFSGEVYFKFYGPTDTNTESPPGSYFLKDKFDKLILLKQAIEDLKLKPIILQKEENRDMKFLLSSKSSQPEIIFKADADFQKVAENLETAVSTEPLLSNIKNKYSSLLYIDLRYGNKVYYRFR